MMTNEHKLESEFQEKLIKRIKDIFGANNVIILKNDSSYIQGIPDLTILYFGRWAMLECKAYEKASHRPNQDYYIFKADKLSFGSFIYPENVDEVVEKLRRYFMSNIKKERRVFDNDAKME